MFFLQSRDSHNSSGVHKFEGHNWLLKDAPSPIFTEESFALFQWGAITGDRKYGNEAIFRKIKDNERDFVLELNGRFQFLLVNLDNGDFVFYNNRYQSGVFSYYQDEKTFILSNQTDQIINYLRSTQSLRVHMPSVHNFLANGFNVSDESLIKGVKKIFPAQWLVKKNAQVEQVSQWHREISFERQNFSDLEKHLDLYEKTYCNGLREYLDWKKPEQLATLLSGGHDTSFVMIQASQVFNKPVHGYTIVFPEWEFSEGGYAENICRKFGGIFHPIDFRKEHLDLSVSLIRANHEPVVGSSLPLHLLAQQASQITDTMLGGDAGDTVWGEYYPVAEYHRIVKNWPYSFRKAFHKAALIARELTDWERFWELEHVSALFADKNPYPDFMRRLCTYRHFSDEIQRRLFNEDSFDVTGFSRGSCVVEFTKDNFREALIEGKLYNAFLTYQAFHTTNCMQAFGLDFFMPTLDKHVVNFINTLPYEWVNGGNSMQRLSNSKSINRKFHKRALARYLKPDEIYNRSFDIPWFMLLKPREALLTALQKRLQRRGWYNEHFLNKMFTEFKEQNHKPYELLELKNHGYRIFTLLSLEIWCTEYLDGRMTSPSDSLHLNLEEYLNAEL